VTFLYNWQHISLKPGDLYNPRELNNTNILPRFKILLNQSDSLWVFLRSHILMESNATNIFDNIITLYSLKDKYENQLIPFYNKYSLVAQVHSCLYLINKHMKDILQLMTENIHSNKVFLQDWKTIQSVLKLPNFDGIVGSQNCWILALNIIVNVNSPENKHNQLLENIAWKHLLPNQRKVMEYYKKNSENLIYLVQTLNEPKLSVLLQELISNIILWRSVHRSRSLQFMKSTMNEVYETSIGIDKNINQIQQQLDSRIKEFSNLKAKISSTVK